MEFPKLEYTHSRLPVALILSYKKRHISKEKKGKEEPSLEKKNRETKQEKAKIKRENW